MSWIIHQRQKNVVVLNLFLPNYKFNEVMSAARIEYSEKYADDHNEYR